MRYVNIDYFRWTNAPDTRGPRQIVDEEEWRTPTWNFGDCDSIDWGVEFQIEGGRVFSVTWVPPGPLEGLELREQGLLESVVSEYAAAAIWDVTSRSRWSGIIGQQIAETQLRYAPWEPGGMWLPRITMRFSQGATVELLLGEAGPDGDLVGPSGDNVAVLFDPADLPPWVRG